MWSYRYTCPSQELYHHGILGQRWGNQNGPPYPLNGSDHSSSEKKAGWRKSLDSSDSSSTSSGGEKSKSKHRQNLEAKYVARGMSQSDAEAAANRRIKAEKVVAVAGAVAVTAAVAYVAHNQYVKNYADQVIKSGTLFQRIAKSDEDLNNPFYAAYKGRDNIIYKGLYGQQLNARSILDPNSDGAYNLSIKAIQDIKAPSRDTASKVFADLYNNNDSFRDGVNREFYEYGSGKYMWNNKQTSVIGKVSNAINQKLSEKTLLKEGYDVFNIGLANHDSNSSSLSKTFYNELKSLGYNAVADVNDSKYSGFKSSSPMIVFDMDSVVKESAKKLTQKEINNNYVAQDLIRNGTTYAAELGLMAGAAAVSVSSNSSKSQSKGNSSSSSKSSKKSTTKSSKKSSKTK